MTTLQIIVDDTDLIADFARVQFGLDQLVDRVADIFAVDIAEEAGQRSSRLGEPWPQEGGGATERLVVAPEFFAHFLAHGTSAHGPTSAPQLVFSVGGEVVFANFVAGISADPFDERAIARTESKVDEIMRQLIALAT